MEDTKAERRRRQKVRTEVKPSIELAKAYIQEVMKAVKPRPKGAKVDIQIEGEKSIPRAPKIHDLAGVAMLPDKLPDTQKRIQKWKVPIKIPN